MKVSPTVHKTSEKAKLIKQLKKLLKDVWNIFWKPEMAILPGQLAFFVILSLVPIITLIGYGASFFDISIDTIIKALQNNFSPSIVEMIAPIIGGQSLDFKLFSMFILMFYIASNGADSIIVTSNAIYDIPQSSWLKRRLKAVFMTVIFVILYLFILLVPAFGTKIIDAIDYFNIKSILTEILTIMQGPISWLIIYMFIKIIYSMAPDRSLPSARLNLGAIFTTTGWVIITYIYSFYIRNFAQYDLFYAGLSNIAVLMLWVYFLSLVFVIGMTLNYQALEEELPKTGSIN